MPLGGALGLCGAPWDFKDIIKEVTDLSKYMIVSFSHNKRSSYSVANSLDKEGVNHNPLLTAYAIFLAI